MLFPIVFTTINTDTIILPKQILLGIAVIALLVIQGVKMLMEKSVKIRRTYFDIPILVMLVIAFLSSLFAVNRADSLIAFFPYLFAILLFFLIINIAKDKNSIIFLMFSLSMGAILLSLSSALSFFKIYLLPFSQTHAQTFTPLGSFLEQDIYLFLVLTMSLYYLFRLLKFKTKIQQDNPYNPYPQNLTGQSAMSKSELTKTAGFGIASIVILMGIIVTTYSLFKLEKPVLLPLETGFQTAFSEISLDSGRIAQGFLVGSGFGTYSNDFFKWKQASFNQNEALWNLTFFRSSNFVLELLATTGVLGICAFIFLLIRSVKEMRISLQNKIFLSLLCIFTISFFLPFSFVTQTLFFIILGLFAANQGLITKAHSRFFDMELQLVTFKKGLIAMEMPHLKNDKSLILPSIISVFILLFVGIIAYFGVTYIVSDLTFQKSLVATSQNNGSLTYQLQGQAISQFPYRDVFYRVFSQTNLALANALAGQQPKDSSPSTTVQQNITTLIQQSINSARSATTIASQNHLNWQNLSAIYRSLIGFGQNAESFAIASAQQSITLDPNDPAQYINLGGIYYQLGQWDNAQNQFQIAITLKTNYANAYYNLGHALEQKGDLANALAQYQTVATLVANDKNSLSKIQSEIETLQNKMQNTNTNTSNNTNSVSQEQQENLNLNTPPAILPTANPQIKIPAPSVATESSR